MKRRNFLIGSAAVVGGFAVGYRAISLRDTNPLNRHIRTGQTALTPYVIVDQDGVTIIAPRAEMGQGIHTTLAAMVAEELDISLSEVTVIHGPASEVYSNTMMFGTRDGPLKALKNLISPRSTQLTGAQTSSQEGFIKMRKAGAAARLALVGAASEALGVDLASLRTSDGTVIAKDGTKISYTELATAAASIDPPKDPPLKPRSEWKQLGRSLPRVDMVSKCTGNAEFAIDLRLPDMLYAVVRRNPMLGGVMKGFDASRAHQMPGVIEIVPIDSGIIVVASNTWYALEASKAIEFDWGPAPYPSSLEEHRASLAQSFEEGDLRIERDDGNVDAVLNDAKVIEGEYRVPYLAHATMEPMNAAALLVDGRLDIWAGTQFPTKAVKFGADIAGLPRKAVNVHTRYLGGGFGRRLEMDFISTAVHAAVAMKGRPVKVTWSREEDMTHDTYRPMAMARFRAAVSDGRPAALDLHVTAPPLFPSSNARETGNYTLSRSNASSKTIDASIAMGAHEQNYEIDNYRITSYASPRLLPVGWWRSVGESQNAFFHETAMDEIAFAAGTDPLKMRLDLLTIEPSRRVLEAVEQMSGWGSTLTNGHAMGVASFQSSGAATALVLEIAQTSSGIRLVKASVAIDVGIALDPRNLEGQVQSSLVFGLTAAISGEITLSDGVVDQTNFHDYRIMRINEMPSIDIYIHESGERIYGAGECATALAAPALGNALFALTGKRIRELPFDKYFRFS